MDSTQRHILLADFTLEGHHFAFLCQFSRALLAEGHVVTCAVPGSKKIQQWIEVNCAGEQERFHEVEVLAPIHNGSGWLREKLSGIQAWVSRTALVRAVENSVGMPVDLLFFAWLDEILDRRTHPFLIDIIFPYKFSGLYFHPYHLRKTEKFLNRRAVWRDFDAPLLSKRCIGVAVHDRGIADAFSKRLAKPVIHFPETADATPPQPHHPLAEAIRHQAKDRIVVGIIGCEKHKGFLNLIRAIKGTDETRFYFALIGILPESSYDPDSWREITNFLASTPENVLTHFHSLREGEEYNSVFCSFDIIYLVYADFISSSNRLTKAAHFGRLVLAQDNYCIGSDVREFDLGETVRPGDPNAIVQGLCKLERRIRESCFPLEQWRMYRELNSEEILALKFKELLSTLN